ncbi:ABC-type polar amino acid transport system ATPase subunit [Streptomyces candidus]|uniref:ABC-type polar amino acid transport system ATPase subunit n=1 Tax=Streptomyces candidus TaxID=67283 RepID=A0A7X0HBJ3_9ACTN|nr:ABC-type polar amino acid transport system ATPase subunit [Streptomyces candidus]GHH36119.1 hypothetical protein GCM10018773_10560 [Streptomyces candidus]
MAVDPLIELRDVSKYFGELHVLQDIGLTVGRGEVVEFFTHPESDRARDFLSEILKH